MVCLEQQRLIAEVQEHLVRLSELAHQEAEALRNTDNQVWLEIDHQIELTIGEKERSLGALNQHRAEHGC